MPTSNDRLLDALTTGPKTATDVGAEPMSPPAWAVLEVAGRPHRVVDVGAAPGTEEHVRTTRIIASEVVGHGPLDGGAMWRTYFRLTAEQAQRIADAGGGAVELEVLADHVDAFAVRAFADGGR